MKANVVFTLQNKSSYNRDYKELQPKPVVFTLQNKSSYNLSPKIFNNATLFLPFKIRAVTTS